MLKQRLVLKTTRHKKPLKTSTTNWRIIMKETEKVRLKPSGNSATFLVLNWFIEINAQ